MVHRGLSHGPEEVVGMYEADGVSGSDGCISEGLSDEALAHADRSDEGRGWSKKRPEFQRMLADAKKGRFDTIVCWKSDRLRQGHVPRRRPRGGRRRPPDSP